MLDHALRAGAVSATEIDRIVRILARFYEAAPTHPVSGPQYVRRLSRDIRANEREIGGYADRFTVELAREVRAAQLRALDRLGRSLSGRGARVVEGHGDLRAEHVSLGRPVAVIDALEFDVKLRLLDPAEDVSLLALEIERFGQPGLADRLTERLCARLNPPPSREVIAFYKSHRAATRAKLAAWHIGDPQFPDAGGWIARTESLLADALRYAQAACGQAASRGPQPSTADGWPAMQERRERRSSDHSAHDFGEEWGHMQFG